MNYLQNKLIMVNFEKAQTEEQRMIEAKTLADAYEARHRDHQKDESPEQSFRKVFEEHHIHPESTKYRVIVDMVGQILAERIIARAQEKADALPDEPHRDYSRIISGASAQEKWEQEREERRDKEERERDESK